MNQEGKTYLDNFSEILSKQQGNNSLVAMNDYQKYQAIASNTSLYKEFETNYGVKIDEILSQKNFNSNGGLDVLSDFEKTNYYIRLNDFGGIVPKEQIIGAKAVEVFDSMGKVVPNSQLKSFVEQSLPLYDRDGKIISSFQTLETINSSSLSLKNQLVFESNSNKFYAVDDQTLQFNIIARDNDKIVIQNISNQISNK